MSLPRFLQYAFIAIVTVTVSFSLYQWNASRAALKVNTSQNFNTNGLVGHWTFDGPDTVWTSSTAGTTLDDSGNGNTGTLTNMNQATAPVDGKIGQAMYFNGGTIIANGVNNRVSIPASTSIQDININKNMTVLLWAKKTGNSISIPSIMPLFNKGPYGGNDNEIDALDFYWSKTSGTTFGVRIGTTAYDSGVVAAPDNEWVHLAFTLESSGGNSTAVRLYKNGAQVYQNLSPGTDLSFDAALPQIGSYTDRQYAFNGLIDDVRVYNRALPASEIASLHTLGTAKLNVSQDSNLTKGLAGYWKFDDGSGTTTADSSTNANNGTFAGTPTPTWTTGQMNGGLTFHATDYVSTSQTPLSSTVPNGFSIFVWLQSPNADAWVYEMGGSNAVSLSTSATGTYCRIRDTSLGFFSTPRSTINADGNWHNFGCIFNRTTNELTLYVDGVSSGTVSTSGFTAFDNGGAPFYLGGRGYGTGGISGSLDEVRIYNRALSADEVNQLYSLTTPTGVDTGLNGYWPFNGSDLSSTTAYDRSGAGNNGTLSSSTITEGRVGQALSFDGASSSVTIANAVSMPNGITVSAWVKPTGLPMSQNTIYLLGTQSTTVGFVWFTLQNDRTIRYNYASGSSYPTYNTTGKIPLNEWSHVLMMHDYGSQNVKIYINGVLDTDVAGGPVVSISNKTAMIGRYLATFPFQGAIDEVRVYNRTLSAGEVQLLYDFGASDKVNSSASQKQGSGRLDSGLTEYWKFDDGSGTTAVNSSAKGTTSNGTLTGSTLPTWGTGHMNGGLDFSGVTGNYVLGPSNYTGFNDNYTISVWAKSTDATTNDKKLVTTYNGFGGISELFYFKKIGINQGIFFSSVGGSTNYYHDITDGAWHHLVATRTISGVETVYADGVQIGQNTTTAGTLTMNFGNTSLRIGGSDGGSMNGSLDEVRIYDRALSADEISQLYRLTTPTGTDTSLKGYWSFNGSDLSGTSAYDRSGAGNNGTTSGATITEGRIGQALSFDGVDDLINMGSPASLDNITDFSYSVWVNVLGAPENARGRIFAKNITGANDTGVSLEYDTGTFHGDVLKASVGFNTTDAEATSQNLWNITGGGNNYTGGWQYVVMTFDGASKAITLYLNGIEVSYQAHTSGVGTRDDDAAENFHIGNNIFGQRTFNGKIDEPRVYNRVLSSTEILSLYNSGR